MRRIVTTSLLLLAAVGFFLVLAQREESVRIEGQAVKTEDLRPAAPAPEAPPGRKPPDHQSRAAPSPAPRLVPHPVTEPPVIVHGSRFDYAGFDAGDAVGSFARRLFENHVVEYLLLDPAADDLADLRRAAYDGDAEAAFAIYAWLKACRDAPVTEKEVAAREQRYSDRITSYPEIADHSLEAHARRLFEACVATDRTVVDREMYHWLRLSADLGYAGGIDAYVWDGQQLAIRLAVRGESGPLEEYRSRAEIYLERLLKTGLPKAFLTASELAQWGHYGPRDFTAAVAYLRALQLIAPEESQVAEDHMSRLELKLDDAAFREGVKKGRDLCRRYVPRECGG